jgi:hypothetical protein
MDETDLRTGNGKDIKNGQGEDKGQIQGSFPFDSLCSLRVRMTASTGEELVDTSWIRRRIERRRFQTWMDFLVGGFYVRRIRTRLVRIYKCDTFRAG